MKYYHAIVYAIGIAFSVALALYPKPAPAQHNHSEGHPDYQEWASGKTTNCCNDEDFGDLNEDEVRETPMGTEVFVHARAREPQWCPVKPEHYIIKGKSPDWGKSHACINHKSFYTNPCDALLCFTGKGQW
jgi:hypothetical protein